MESMRPDSGAGTVESLISRVPIACGVFDVQGVLLACNEQWASFFGEDDSQEISRDFYEFLPQVQANGENSDEYLQKCLNVATEDGYVKFGLLCHTRKKAVLHMNMHCKPLEDGLYIACATIMKFKEIETESLRLAAEEESRAKTRFLARMSHEIRTPMNAIMGITEMQLTKGGHPPETAEAFARIYTSSNMLISIINDILDFSKVEAGKMEIVKAPYDVASLLVDTVQLNIMHIGSRSISFRLNIDHTLPAQLEGDQLRIRQVMNNLLSNAFKYTAEGSVSLDVWYKTHSQDSELIKLFMRVKDTGQGMTQEQLGDIFKLEFTRFNVQNNRIVEGTGLGMNISKQLISLMGGTINVESKIGEGTSFTVTLPQKRLNDLTLGTETVENLQNFDTTERALKRINQLKYTPMPYGKVLIVDDVESNLFVAKGLLIPYKLTVETVDNGFDAVQKVKNGSVYDIIFMDHMMPGMNGIEAVKAIRELGYQNTIIALTANTIVGQSDMYLANGFSGFLSKPIDINQLNANLLRFIRDKQSREVLDAAGGEYVLGQEYELEPVLYPSVPNVEAEQKEVSPRVLESFVRDAQKAKVAIEKVLGDIESDPENIKVYVIHVHALKSALGNVNEFNLSQIAASLEQAGRELDYETIKLITPGFLGRLDVAKDRAGLTNTPAKQESQVKKEEKSEADGDEFLTVFAVDDSDTNLVLVEEALEEKYNVVTMPSAERLFKMLVRVKPKLILLDIEMPEMNGYEAIKKLKENKETAGIPVVFMTATVTPDISAKCAGLGAVSVVAKPFESSKLLERVDEWVKNESNEKTILIIDDTPMIISALSRILSPHYRVKAAKDGESGLKIAQEHKVDLILLDISMPNMSGFEVIERLKKSAKTIDIPVIFITGSTEAEDEATGFSLGAIDYLKKPFTQESVLHRVRLYLDGGGRNG